MNNQNNIDAIKTNEIPVSPTQMPTDVAHRPDLKRYSLIVVGLLLLISITSLSLYSLGTNQQKAPLNETAQENDLPTTATSLNSSLNTDTWIVQSNSQEKYLLKHPSDWQATQIKGHLISLVSPIDGLTVHLQNIKTGSKEETVAYLNEKMAQSVEHNKNFEDSQYNYTFEEKILGEKTAFLTKRISVTSESVSNDYLTAFVIDGPMIAQFVVTKNYTDPDVAEIIETIYSTFEYDDSLEGKGISFKSDKLGATFDYPSKLGTANESAASQGKGGSEISGEEWWRISFNKTGFEPGYYEVSASTSNYKPMSWEGVPHWFNAKISASDTEDSVKQKLIAENWQVIKVQKVQNNNGVNGFKVWMLDCYVNCNLSSAYLVPLANSDYNNLLIYTMIKSLDIGEENMTVEQAKVIAEAEISKLENSQSTDAGKEYLNGQNLIFNSLTISR